MVISITSLKGGVGKSTISQNLAACFAHAGYKVCIVDVDTNQSAIRWSGLRSEEYPGIPVVGMPDGIELSKNVKHLAKDYEIVLIDGTPSLNKVTSKIILLADVLLIPILPSGLDIWATEQFLERYQDAVNEKESAIPAYFILNQFQPQTNLAKEVREVLEDTSIAVFKTALGNRTAYREAVIKGIGVIEYKDPKAKNEMVALYNELITYMELVNA
ncbi:ParA family partition ATPase [Siphonobacter curvatus]|uniref:Chromosome partitioning protein n=1 Tax=Siphonobacter curvatus TaxID=2094562 RepID=A0A2S7IET7_9BACT|nr:ParA family partition ATPase [Siphonobacter curvatus]PQA53414.1 chromosome partitioning protein [Siphonobacter curvatus]